MGDHGEGYRGMIKKGRGTWRRAIGESVFLWGLGLVIFLTIKSILGI